jgi:hypothetical protein
MSAYDRIEKNRTNRLEDSFSLPENQTKHAGEDEYVVDREKIKIEKLHERNLDEECKKILGVDCII